MLTILVLAIAAAMVLVLVLLAGVVIGIRQEPLTDELNRQAPNLFAAVVRRILGVYVRKPDPNLNEQGKPCLAARRGRR